MENSIENPSQNGDEVTPETPPKRKKSPGRPPRTFEQRTQGAFTRNGGKPIFEAPEDGPYYEGLTLLQRRFCIEIVKDFNQSAAYRRAGYTVKNDNVAKVRGYELMQDPRIIKAVRAICAGKAKRAKIDHNYVLYKLVDNVERAFQEVPVTDREGNPVGEYVYQGQVVNKALELIGKHIHFFPEAAKGDVNVNVGIQNTNNAVAASQPPKNKLLADMPTPLLMQLAEYLEKKGETVLQLPSPAPAEPKEVTPEMVEEEDDTPLPIGLKELPKIEEESEEAPAAPAETQLLLFGE